MNLDFLDFEQPIADLEAKIEELRNLSSDNGINITLEIQKLEDRNLELTREIYSNLSSWQISKVSRHPGRPYTLDYLDRIFKGFEELHGDRGFKDDPALVCGIAYLDKQPVMVIGHQKGREVKEKMYRNFGMPRPEGYRKALRMMQLAERFRMPIITFVDTPGAYPGIDAEERGQSEAIAKNLLVMARLKTPIISVVIGEGGSGGALAISVADSLSMLQYSTYSVISPEGCASILWKTAERASDAAEAMGITAERLKQLNLIDNIIPEPTGGAHRDMNEMASSLRLFLEDEVKRLSGMSDQALIKERYARLKRYSQV